MKRLTTRLFLALLQILATFPLVNKKAYKILMLYPEKPKNHNSGKNSTPSNDSLSLHPMSPEGIPSKQDETRPIPILRKSATGRSMKELELMLAKAAAQGFALRDN